MKKHYIYTILPFIIWIGCLITYNIIGSEVLHNWTLVKPFWLIPIAYLFFLIGIIWTIIFIISYLFKNNKIYNPFLFIKTKIKYIFIIILIIYLWLVSRSINEIPLFVWDTLRAMMFFYIILFLTDLQLKYVALVSIIICFWIEFSQFMHFELLDSIRNTSTWTLFLWKWFLYADLISYLVWVFLCYMINILMKTNTTKKYIKTQTTPSVYRK